MGADVPWNAARLASSAAELDGKPILHAPIRGGAGQRFLQVTFKIPLHSGENRLLIKITKCFQTNGFSFAAVLRQKEFVIADSVESASQLASPRDVVETWLDLRGGANRPHASAWGCCDLQRWFGRMSRRSDRSIKPP